MEQPTCGKGLAEHSVVPQKLAELLASLAESLEAHVPTIDSKDPNGLPEREAYGALAAEYHVIAGRLLAVARQMSGYRDLPMARHHEAALTAPRIMSAFRRFVDLQGETAGLIQRT